MPRCRKSGNIPSPRLYPSIHIPLQGINGSTSRIETIGQRCTLHLHRDVTVKFLVCCVSCSGKRRTMGNTFGCAMRVPSLIKMDAHFSNGLNLMKTESLYVTRRRHRSRLDTINLNLHSEKSHQRLLLCPISANIPDAHDQRRFSHPQPYFKIFSGLLFYLFTARSCSCIRAARLCETVGTTCEILGPTVLRMHTPKLAPSGSSTHFHPCNYLSLLAPASLFPFLSSFIVHDNFAQRLSSFSSARISQWLRNSHFPPNRQPSLSIAYPQRRVLRMPRDHVPLSH